MICKVYDYKNGEPVERVLRRTECRKRTPAPVGDLEEQRYTRREELLCDLAFVVISLVVFGGLFLLATVVYGG